MAEPWSGLRSRNQDLRYKLEQLSGVARQHGVSTLVLQEPANLTWLLECRVHVPQTLESACLAAVVETGTDQPRVRIVTNAIEAPRLLDTELADVDVDWQVLPWWESRTEALPAGVGVGTDRSVPGCVDIAGAVLSARRKLTTRQQALLAEVCADTAAASTEVAELADPSMTEQAAAGHLADALLARGLDPIVLMVGGGTRPERHRHPLPTPDPLGDRATLVCCARRDGLVASCTRIVAFAPLSPGDRARYDALLEVERCFLDATRPTTRVGDVFARGVAAYAAHGFDRDEWHRHHQGGLTGFQPREFPAHAGSDVELCPGMAVAWNPSAAGWKVEDTCLVAPDGVQPLVHHDEWPSLTVGGRARPDVWVR
jgi:Xaa-Pro aminopeptidase